MFRRLFPSCVIATLAAPAMANDSELIAAGAGYRRPMLDLVQAFTTATGIKAEASFGNMKQVEVQAQQNPDITLLIELSLAAINGRDGGNATRAFVDFVGTPAARAVLQRHGL